jgi:hypothetical protein
MIKLLKNLDIVISFTSKLHQIWLLLKLLQIGFLLSDFLQKCQLWAVFIKLCFRFLSDKIDPNLQKNCFHLMLSIWLMLSICLCPKVITLSGFNCIRIKQNQIIFVLLISNIKGRHLPKFCFAYIITWL